MVQSLHAFRGLFAILIFIHHYNLYGVSNHIGGGTSSVVFFFILSGFVISSRYQDKMLHKSKGGSVREFVLKRIEKVYPLHIFCIFLWLIALGTLESRHVKIYICNILLLQSWIPNKDYYFSCNGVSWYLSSLLFCYIMYPLLVQLISFAKRKRIASRVIVAMFILYNLVVVFVSDEARHAVIYIHPLMRIVDFILGILLWNIVLVMPQNYRKMIGVREAGMIQMSVLIVLSAFFVVYNMSNLPERFTLVSYWWIPIILLIATYYALDDYDTYINKFLKIRCIQKFADLSFSFFMIHQIFIIVWKHYLGEYFICQSLEITLVFVLAICALIAGIINRYIEFGSSVVKRIRKS